MFSLGHSAPFFRYVDGYLNIDTMNSGFDTLGRFRSSSGSSLRQLNRLVAIENAPQIAALQAGRLHPSVENKFHASSVLGVWSFQIIHINIPLCLEN